MTTAVSINPYTQMCPAFTAGQPTLHPYIIDQITEKCHQAATKFFKEQWSEGTTELIYQSLLVLGKLPLIFDRACISNDNFMTHYSSYYISEKAREWLKSSGICNYQLRYEEGLFTNSKFLPSYEQETKQKNCEKKLSPYTNYQSFKGNLLDTFNTQKQPLFALLAASQYLKQLEKAAKSDPYFNLDLIENFLQKLFDQMSDIKMLTDYPSKYQKLLNASIPLLEIRKSIWESLTDKPDDHLFRGLTDVFFIIVQSLKKSSTHSSLDNNSLTHLLQLSNLVLKYVDLDKVRDAAIVDLLDSLFVICKQDSCKVLIEQLYIFLMARWNKKWSDAPKFLEGKINSNIDRWLSNNPNSENWFLERLRQTSNDEKKFQSKRI